MPSRYRIMIGASLAILAFVCHAAVGSDASDGDVSALATSVDANGDDTASIPDFDGDGTIGFGDFVIFAGVFGARQGDEKYDATYDLNGDGEIGFSDFVIFAQKFGKEVPSPVVAIPDANFRAVIEAALGKATGAPITRAEMATLDSLEANDANITDLTGLESAVNLTELRLNGNNIEDVSALAGLTNLTDLWLGFNDITDVSALSGLTNLTELWLEVNNITDISALSGLTNLTDLWLGFNDITDVSALSGLTNLTVLWLTNNSITDVSALSDLTNLRGLVISGNAIMDVSALSDLTNLRGLVISGNAIMDVSALSGLTNLTVLRLTNNSITDVSALSDLTNLTVLVISGNAIMDVSALSDLTNLRGLRLNRNNIEDVSALAGLTNLERLELGSNNIADISALSDLTNLTELDLGFNIRIRDISALVGLTHLISLDIRGNSLSDSSINDHIPALKSNGVTVLYDFWRVVGDFDIELVLLSSFTERQKEELQYAVRRWMAVITKDLPDYTFTQNWSGRCGGQSYEIPSGERIDDLRIYVRREEMEVGGWGGPHLLREETHLPVLGCMAFNPEEKSVPYLAIHEIAHVLGFGPIWEVLGFYQNPPDGDEHFNGPLAIAAFNDAGGWGYTGKKVPLENRAHWRLSVLPDEIMITGSGGTLSAITVQSLADLGYGVDVTQADPYTLPGATAGKMAAKISSYQPSAPGPVLDLTRPTISPSRNVDLYGQGRVWDGPSAILGDGRRTGRLNSLAQVWTGHTGFNDNQVKSYPDLRDVPESTLTCGAGQMNEPIYVVDAQGRIVRTIHR